MKTIHLVLTAALLSGAATPAACGESNTKDWLSSFGDGAAPSREATIRELSLISAQSTPDFEAVGQKTAEIRSYYLLRARRQQTFIDGMAGGTGIAATGYLVTSSSAAKATWGTLALTPLLLGQLNAYDPTQALYQGGAEGLEKVSTRYVVIKDAANELATHIRSGVPVETNCKFLAEKTWEAVKSWEGDGADVLIVLNEARQIDKACKALSAQNVAIIKFSTAATAAAPRLSRAYASDILALDDAVRERDYVLRSDGGETLQQILAAPFNLASSLLTGEKRQEALNALQTQTAFTAMDIPVTPILLPPAPDYTPAPTTVSENIWTRSRPGIARGNGAPDSKVNGLIAAIGAAALELADSQKWTLHAMELVRAIQQEARVNRLSFTYNAVTKTVESNLGPVRGAETPQPAS